MAPLSWDQAGARQYETGIDRGVLYLRDGAVVPWNGLTSVIEDRSLDVKSYYLDGVKYLDSRASGAYSAKLQAFTYPDALDDVLGNTELAPGVTAYDQRAKLFHLSYRSRIANDLEGMDYAYKVHLVYNVMAALSSVAYDTVGDTVSAHALEWSLSGTPDRMFGLRPTSHLSVDSRTIAPDKLLAIENLLYGTDASIPEMPGLVTVVDLVT